jgi:inorganic pyrophosphatase
MKFSFFGTGTPVYIIFLLMLFSVWYCSNRQMRNFNAIPTFSRNYVNAVIEIPAGTNHRIRYNEEQKMFLVEQADGSGAIIDFLPYPGNYGFVPGTFLDPVMGGGGYPLDILVISESLPTGSVIEVIPLLVLYFQDESDIYRELPDPKIIAIPANQRFRVLKAESYEDLFEDYPVLVEILIKWFGSYRGHETYELKAIGDGEVAVNEIRKWEIRRF